MKRYIRSSTSIFGMADDAAKLLSLMDGKSLILLQHIGKCIIWGKNYHSYSHWVEDEIATFINEIARKKPKSKIKSRTIQNHLFQSMGTEHWDALYDLLDIYEDSQRKSVPYPEVDIDEEMSIRFFQCYNEFKVIISDYLSLHKHVNGRVNYKDEIIPLIYGVLDKYC